MAGCLAAATCAENLGKENDELRAENSLCKGQIGNQEASRLCRNEKAHLPGGPCPASGTRTLEGPQPLADERASRQRAGQAEPASSRGLGSSPGRVRRDPPRTPGRCVLTGFPSPHACRHSWGRGTKRGPCGSTGRELGGPPWAPTSPRAPPPSMHFAPFLSRTPAVSPGSPRSLGVVLGTPTQSPSTHPGLHLCFCCVIFWNWGKETESCPPHRWPSGRRDSTHT